MAQHFKKHYTREEARQLLPKIRTWLETLDQRRMELEKSDQRLAGLMNSGRDAGGTLANNWVKSLADIRELLKEFEHREIIIKDLERGLIDFPSLMGGKEVF